MKKRGFSIIALFFILISLNLILASDFGYNYLEDPNSFFGDVEFDGGWENGGCSIIDGDLYCQVGYFINITALDITQENLTVTTDTTIIGNFTVDSPLFHVDSINDRIGIGTSSPAKMLHLKDADEYQMIALDRTDHVNVDNIFYVGPSWATVGGVVDQLRISSDAGNIMSMNSDGKIGIGTTSPAANTKLHIKLSAANEQGLRIERDDSTNVAAFIKHGASRSSELGLYDSGNNLDIFLNTAGNSYLNGGNVGIGTSSPETQLHLEGTANIKLDNTASADPSITLEEDGTPKWYIGSDRSDASEFYVRGDGGGSDRFFVIEQTGNVGIGTTSPGHLLHLHNEGNTYLNIDSTTDGNYEVATKYSNHNTGANWWWTGINNEDDYSIAYGNAFTVALTNLKIKADGNMQFGDFGASTSKQFNFIRDGNIVGSIGTNNSELNFIGGSGSTPHLTIESSGEVGIGTVNPSERLEVAGADPRIFLDNDDAVDGVDRTHIKFGNQGTSHFITGHLYDSTDADNRYQIMKGDLTPLITVMKGGNVGIGTTTPSAKLEIHNTDDANVEPLKIFNDNGNLIAGFEVNNAGHGYLRVQKDDATSILFVNGDTARVGIGTGSPGHDLQIGDGSSTGTTLALRGYDGGDPRILFEKSDGGDIGVIGFDHSQSTEKMYISQSSFASGQLMTFDFGSNRVGIGTSSPAVPLHVVKTSSGGTTDVLTIQNAASTTGTATNLKFVMSSDASTTSNGLFKLNNVRQSDGSVDVNFLLAPGSSGVAASNLYIEGSTGNVGIGVTDPAVKLEVLGSGRFGSTTNGIALVDQDSRGNIFGYDTDASAWNDVWIGTGASPIGMIIKATTGNVGIGTSSPLGNLDVTSAIDSNTFLVGGEGYDAHLYMYADQGDDDADKWGFEANPDGKLRIQSYSTSSWVDQMTFDGSGNVGIGTATPSQPLHVEGNLNVTGEIYNNAEHFYGIAVANHSVDAINTWYNLTFDDNLGMAEGITFESNKTAIIQSPGHYSIYFGISFIDYSPSPSENVAMRITLNDTEIEGSYAEETMTKQNAQHWLSDTTHLILSEGDRLNMQYIAGDTDVNVSSLNTWSATSSVAYVYLQKVAPI